MTVLARFILTLSVATVSAIAAWASYWHMVHLALRYGEPAEVAYVLPLSVDGLLTVAALVIADDRAHHRPTRTWARIAVIIGLTASITANITAADPTLPGRLIAAWPPIALFLIIEILATDHTRMPPPAPSVPGPPDVTTSSGVLPDAQTLEGATSGSSALFDAAPGPSGPESIVVPEHPAEHVPGPVAMSAATPGATAPPDSPPEPERNERNTERNPLEEVPGPRADHRPAHVTRDLAAQLASAHPHLTQKDIADRLGISARRLRAVQANSTGPDLPVGNGP